MYIGIVEFRAMKFILPLALAISSLSLIAAPRAQAVTLVAYSFDNATSFLSASSVGVGISASDLSPNTGNTLGDNTGFVRSSSNTGLGSGILAITFANVNDTSAPSAGNPATDNLTFTLLPTDGLPLQLQQLTFLTNTSSTTNSPTNGGFYTLQYDDLSDAAGFLTLGTNGDIFQRSSITASQVVDLSAPAFQNLTEGITFRINFHDNVTGGGQQSISMRIDELTVTGVPEPATAGLLAGGGALLLGQRRRRALALR
jgi:hypothetical protein